MRLRGRLHAKWIIGIVCYGWRVRQRKMQETFRAYRLRLRLTSEQGAPNYSIRPLKRSAV
jgi:hypothetical protein